MTFDIEQRVAANRRRAAGTAGIAAFLLAVLAGLAVLLLAKGGGGTAGALTSQRADGSLSSAPAPGASSDPGTPGAPAAVTDTGVAALRAAADGTAAGGANGAPSAAPSADERSATVLDEAPVPPEAELAAGVAPDPSGGSFVPPARRVTLPAGAEQVEEYPVRFPQTPEGAAAASVAMTRYSATLDYLTASEVLRLYTAADHAGDADAAATAGVQAARQRLGVPLTGDPPLDASLVALPIGVQWTSDSPEAVRVSVLSVAEYRYGDRLERELVSVNSYLQWDGAAGDWKFYPAPDGGMAGPGQAELGSQAFNDNGWAAITEERR